MLDQPRRDEIARLINTYRDPDGNSISTFWNACSFADDARAKANRNVPGWSRFDVFETWHYVNVPRSTTVISDTACVCVISAVSHHVDSLRTAASDRSKAEALFFLAHWVGDIHQPLHAAYADDRGGNDVRPITSDFYSATNLHSLWDANILARLMPNPDWQAFADRLVRDLTPAEQASWIRTRPVDWAQESYNLVTSTEAQYCDWKQEAGSDHLRSASGRTLDGGEVPGRVRGRRCATPSAGRRSPRGAAETTPLGALNAESTDWRQERMQLSDDELRDVLTQSRGNPAQLADRGHDAVGDRSGHRGG